MRKEHLAGLIGFGAGSAFTLLVLSVLTGAGTFQANSKTFWSVVFLGGAIPGPICLTVVALSQGQKDDPGTAPTLSGPQTVDIVRQRYGDPGEQVAIAAGISALTHPTSPAQLTELLRAVHDFSYLPEPEPAPEPIAASTAARPAMPPPGDLPDPDNLFLSDAPLNLPMAELDSHREDGLDDDMASDPWDVPPTEKRFVVEAWE